MCRPEADRRAGRFMRQRPPSAARPAGAVLLLIGLIACESVTVAVVDVEQVEVQPAAASLVAGATTRLEAVVHGPEGSLLEGREVSWSSSDESVATVDAEGLVTGHGEGSALISARVEGVSGSAAVEVLPAPNISPERSEVSFQAPRNGNDPPAQTVRIDNAGAGELTGLAAEVDYTDGQPTGWLSASLADSRAPTTLTLRATTGSLPEGTHTARVILRSAGGGQELISVSFAVGDPEPRIGLQLTEVEFRAVVGQPAPAPAEIRITNAGGQSLTGLGASVDYRQGGSGWLTTALSPSTAPATLTLRVDHAGLDAGTHVAVVSVLSGVAVNSPREITVRLVVSEPPPSIVLERSTVQFTATEGGADPAAVEVDITNGGGGTLGGLSTSISWGEGARDWLDLELSGTQAPATLTLRADTDGLDAGEYDAVVRVSAPGAEATATLAVLLRIEEPDRKPPNADFTAECTLLSCSFQDRSEDPDGEVRSWRWDFGDGSGSSDRNPQHTYVLPGTYTVTLEVTDDDGATDQASREVTVFPPDSNDPPIADFEVDCDDLECEFEDESRDNDGRIVAHAWSFGDGATSTKRDPEHEYDRPGTYVVSLTVTDDDGATDTKEVSVTVEDDDR